MYTLLARKCKCEHASNSGMHITYIQQQKQ